MKNKKAFSLTEIIFALAIVTIALVPLIGLFFRGTSTMAKAEEVTLATAIASKYIAKYDEKRFEELYAATKTEESFKEGFFNVNVKIEKDYDGDDNKLVIFVTVKWYDRYANKNREIRLAKLKVRANIP